MNFAHRMGNYLCVLCIVFPVSTRPHSTCFANLVLACHMNRVTIDVPRVMRGEGLTSPHLHLLDLLGT